MAEKSSRAEKRARVEPAALCSTAAASGAGSKAFSAWLASSEYGVIDARPAAAFAACRIDGTTNLALSTIETRFFELPPPHRKAMLGLVAGGGFDGALAMRLTARGYVVGFALTWAEAHAAATARAAARVLSDIALTPASIARLWSPSPCLEALVDDIESATTPRYALDFGCGVGRDCVFLAQRGWSVGAIDYLAKKALTKCVDLARAYLVDDRVDALAIDLTVEGCTASAELAPLIARAGLLHLARFMHRPLIAELLRCAPIGCCIVVHQFCEGSQFVGPCRPKKPRFLVQPGELRRDAEARGWEVLSDEEHPIDDGRPLSWFLAVRRSEKT